jgi:hypothetical protein
MDDSTVPVPNHPRFPVETLRFLAPGSNAPRAPEHPEPAAAVAVECLAAAEAAEVVAVAVDLEPARGKT